MTRIAIIGGGPAGYEAALVAVQLGAEVTLVDRDGVGGMCVLADCVPSKTLIATSEAMTTLSHADRVGVHSEGSVSVQVDEVHARVKALALAQSNDIAARLVREGVSLLSGPATLLPGKRVQVGSEVIAADVVLLATGASPRVVAGAEPDGERILDWRQLYDLPALPEHLVVVGSGVTGAEFASAYLAMGCQVTLVSSRDRVLPSEDPDAAEQLQQVFVRRGMRILRGRAAGVERTDGGVVVNLVDGSSVAGSHCLMTVGSVPNTGGMGLEEAGVQLDAGGFIKVDRVSRTTADGVYAAGDVARWHNPQFDRSMRLEHWTSAAEQGAAAARNALNAQNASPYTTVPYFWSDWYTDKLQMVGITAADEVKVVGDLDGERWVALYRSGDSLIGALALNLPGKIMKYRAMIMRGTTWDDAQSFAAA